MPPLSPPPTPPQIASSRCRIAGDANNCCRLLSPRAAREEPRARESQAHARARRRKPSLTLCIFLQCPRHSKTIGNANKCDGDFESRHKQTAAAARARDKLAHFAPRCARVPPSRQSPVAMLGARRLALFAPLMLTIVVGGRDVETSKSAAAAAVDLLHFSSWLPLDRFAGVIEPSLLKRLLAAKFRVSRLRTPTTNRETHDACRKSQIACVRFVANQTGNKRKTRIL